MSRLAARHGPAGRSLFRRHRVSPGAAGVRGREAHQLTRGFPGNRRPSSTPSSAGGYKPPFGHDEAVEIIRKGSGTHFDPDVCAAFLQITFRFKEIASHFTDHSEPPQEIESLKH